MWMISVWMLSNPASKDTTETDNGQEVGVGIETRRSGRDEGERNCPWTPRSAD